VKVGDRLLLMLGPPLAAFIMRLIHFSVKTETLGEEQLRNIWSRGERVILSFWHDQLFLMVFGYPGKRAKILISSSKDGELIARTMAHLKHEAVRGSSSRGGRAAFKEMVALGKSSADIVFTPDGPRGPRHELKDGIVQLARMSGRPVVPLAFACSRGHRFQSWDHFLLPYPFCRGVYSYGKPLYYSKEEGVDKFRERLKIAMIENQRQAEARLESYGVSAI